MNVSLTRRAIPQPHPKLYPGGDCAACVLGGLLGLDSPQEVYDMFSEGRPEPTCWETARTRLGEAKTLGLLDRFIDHVPLWPQTFQGRTTWGHPSWSMALEWFAYLTMALDAGYYGITSVDFEGNGPDTETDHAILLCGVRTRKEPVLVDGKKLADRIVQEVLVSCSSKGEYWIQVGDLLKRFGGFNVLLARPGQVQG